MQISHEIECALHRWSNLEAKMVITCEREAWVASSVDSLVPESFRVTFDDNLSWLEIGSEPLWSSLLDRGESIMEIKSVGPYPMWMIDALDQTCAYPRSFSKYGAAYLDIETQKHAEPVQHRNARHLRRKNPKIQPENVAAPTLAW